MHIELQTFSSTASAATGTVAAAFSGDSATIRNGRGKIAIIAAWFSANTNNVITQLVFPSGHDTTRGYRVGVPGGPLSLTLNAANLTLPLGSEIPIQAQETMVITNIGSAVAGDIDSASYLIHYDDFPGISARLINSGELESRTDKLTTVVSSITDAGGGLYNEEVITLDSDLLRANRDYALVGMSTTFPCHAITFFSPDNGNTRTGCPGNLRTEVTAQWFNLLSRATGVKAIPVFNSGNKGQVRVGFVGDENAATRIVTMHLALLK